MGLQRERREDFIWSDLKLGGHLEPYAILFKSWSKIRSNCKHPSIIVTNISRSPPHTTSWFIEVRQQHFKTNLQGLWSHVHILIVSKLNLKLSALFRVLFALWSLKYPHPKSQQTPRVSAELEMVVNLSYSFILLQKISQKGACATKCPSAGINHNILSLQHNHKWGNTTVLNQSHSIRRS